MTSGQGAPQRSIENKAALLGGVRGLEELRYRQLRESDEARAFGGLRQEAEIDVEAFLNREPEE